ncbi:MAG: hypothetical protein LAO19_07290 [Acidobacteriia bacterium]|nr:hypothetical protein [Terriglobia bacterium]
MRRTNQFRMRGPHRAPVTLTFPGAHFYTYMAMLPQQQANSKACYDSGAKREGTAQVHIPQIARKIGPAIFLLWLLLINFFYYAQFRELALSRLPWLARLWR